MSLFTDFLKSIHYKFDNLKDKGLPPSTFEIGSFFGDIPEQYPDRYNFYIQLLESLNSANPEAVYFLLSKENLQRINKQRKNKSLKVIDDFFQERMMELKDLKDNLTEGTKEIYQYTPLENLYQLQRELSKENNINIDTKLYLFKNNDTGTALNITNIKKLFNDKTSESFESTDLDTLKKIIERKKLLLELKDLDSKIQKVTGEKSKHIQLNNLKVSEVVQGGGVEEFKERIFGDKNTDAIDKENNILKKDLVTDKDLERFHRDPKYSPENEQITMVDRVVFIAATYIIRAIAMFLLEWAVHINFVNTFVKGFALYFGVYFCVFILLYMLTNASEKDEVFRMIFYYIYTKSDGGNGIVRIWAHLICVFMLIPIPFVVREYREFEKDSMTFAEKRTILTGVSRFSLYIWLLTSLVALKV